VAWCKDRAEKNELPGTLERLTAILVWAFAETKDVAGGYSLILPELFR
jgi:hypothetical protein